MANSLLDGGDLPPAVSSRAAALVGRQALEESLATVWRKRGAIVDGPAGASFREQLLGLRMFDEDLEQRASSLWWQLTRACHHHPYELTPTRTEISELLSVTAGQVDALIALDAAASTSAPS